MALLRSFVCEMERPGSIARTLTGDPFNKSAYSSVLHGNNAADSGEGIHRKNRKSLDDHRFSLWREHSRGGCGGTSNSLDIAPPFCLLRYPTNGRCVKCDLCDWRRFSLVLVGAGGR